MSRDRAVDAQLAAAGWTVLRFWESEIARDLPDVVHKVIAAVRGNLIGRRRAE